MDKDFLFTHALSIWRAIEAEGRAFPAINVSVGVSGFAEGEEHGRGIQGFLVPGRPGMGAGGMQAGGGNAGTGAMEGLGKRKREEEGIAKFFGKREDNPSPDGGNDIKPYSPDDVEEDIALPDETELEDQMETYLCPKCQKQISIVEMEIHEDYHVALDLSRGSPVRAAPLAPPAKGKIAAKKGRKEGKKEAKGVEKGQMKLPFGM